MNENETDRIVKPNRLLVNEIPMDERVSQLLERYREYGEIAQWFYQQQRMMKGIVMACSVKAIEDEIIEEGLLMLREETYLLIEPIYDDAQEHREGVA